MKKLMNDEADLILGFFFITSLRLKFFDSIESHIGFPFVLIVPPGEKFSSLEKIFRPFQLSIWIAIFAVLFCGILIIFITNTTRNKNLRQLIFGEVVNSPYLNMVDIFFGGSMSSLPKKTFSRLLLSTFLIFCFVVRNSYQGLLFQNMQSDDRAKPVMTVEEMIEKNFDFHMYPDFIEHSKPLKFFSR